MRPPLKESPAPVVSLTRTDGARTHCTSPGPKATHPSGPSLMTTLPPEIRCSSLAAASGSSSWSRRQGYFHTSAWKGYSANFAQTAFSEVRAGILDGLFAADLELRWPVQGSEIIRRSTEADRHDDRAQGRPVHPARDHVSQVATQ